MDPQVILNEIRDSLIHNEEPRDEILDLLAWLDKGGYTPLNWNDTREELYKWLISAIQ